MLWCLLAAFTGCTTAEPVGPKGGLPEALPSGPVIECIVYNGVRTDTITKGTYLGFTIGEQASTSYAALQQLWEQQKINAIRIALEVASDLPQIEQSLPLYHELYLRDAESRGSAEVVLRMDDGKVRTIYLGIERTLSAQWPASAPASVAVKAGDPTTTVYQKLLALKDKPGYAGYFGKLYLSQGKPAGYEPAMGLLPQWEINLNTTNFGKEDIRLQFHKGSLSAIYHLKYF